MEDRYFYHNFPRRGVSTPDEIDKGCQILASIRDFGLLLVPEYFEWNQPTANGDPPRIFPVLQKRICFTELAPHEVSQHADKFGRFALEFEGDTVRRLGAIPVFYLPKSSGPDGNALGVGLLGITIDAWTIINRMAELDKILNGARPVAEKLNLEFGFTRSPDEKGTFTVDSAEAKRLIAAVGHGTTPWEPLKHGARALLNFFYPADDTKHGKLLEYYRQREWRIACAFAINGTEVLHAPTPVERDRFLEIDPKFFGKQIDTDLGQVNALDEMLVHPGVGGTPVIEMVRRVIVPADAVDHVTQILSSLASPPPVVATEDVK